jgi:hypothetical protein
MNQVMALAGLAEYGDPDIFEQAGISIFEISGFRSLHREDFLIPVHLRKCEPAR